MPKDYKNVRKARGGAGRQTGNILSFIAGLTMGVVVYLLTVGLLVSFIIFFSQSGHRIFQIGSYKGTYEAANQVKVQLASIGVSADIQRMVDSWGTSYRVTVGPYKDGVNTSRVYFDQLIKNKFITRQYT